MPLSGGTDLSYEILANKTVINLNLSSLQFYLFVTHFFCNNFFLCKNTGVRFSQGLKEKFTPKWPYFFFTPIKSLQNDMLFTKILASNER